MFLEKKTNLKINNKNKRGLTLIESMIVFAIFAVFIGGILALVNNVQRNAAVGEETNNLTTIYSNIDGYFRRGSTAGLNNELSQSAGFLPGGMLIEGEGANTEIANSFGGYIEILGSGDIADNSRGFSVQYTRVPQAACVNFVQGQVRTGWDTVAIEGSETTGTTGGQEGTPLFMFSNSEDVTTAGASRGNIPLPELRIINECNVDTNYVVITFVKDSNA